MTMGIRFVSRTSGIVFNPSTGAIIDHSQIRETDLYFKSQLYVDDLTTESWY